MKSIISEYAKSYTDRTWEDFQVVVHLGASNGVMQLGPEVSFMEAEWMLGHIKARQWEIKPVKVKVWTRGKLLSRYNRVHFLTLPGSNRDEPIKLMSLSATTKCGVLPLFYQNVLPLQVTDKSGEKMVDFHCKPRGTLADLVATLHSTDLYLTSADDTDREVDFI